MPTVLAISPHLDDAAFSAGGTLVRYARQGWRVIIASVFTASVADPTGFALACQVDKGISAEIDYMAIRREEDARACAIIGAEPLWLPFAEAPHRFYATADELFTGLHGDDDIVDRITPVLERLVETEAIDLVLAPQAVGAHVDHLAVHLSLRRCWRSMQFWVDFPYAARAIRNSSPFSDALLSLPRLEVKLSDVELRAKCAAACAYESQLRFQFGGRAETERMMRSMGGTERYAQRAQSSP